jgi:hypothetical protein
MDGKTMHVCDALADLILALRTAKLDSQFADEIAEARAALMGARYGEAKDAQHEECGCCRVDCERCYPADHPDVTVKTICKNGGDSGCCED